MLRKILSLTILLFLVSLSAHADQTLNLIQTSCNNGIGTVILRATWRNNTTGCEGSGSLSEPTPSYTCGSFPAPPVDVVQHLNFCKPGICCYFQGWMPAQTTTASNDCLSFNQSFVAVHWLQ